MSNWKIGEKIVCVEKFIGRDHLTGKKTTDGNWPIVGIIYEFDGWDGYDMGRCEFLFIKGFDFKNKYGVRESFAPWKFRKLSEVSAELSEEILEKIKVTEEEPITV